MMLGVGRVLAALGLSLMTVLVGHWNQASAKALSSNEVSCPSSVGLVPDFNSGQLAHAALKCFDDGFDDEALQLLIASHARNALDLLYFPPMSVQAGWLSNSRQTNVSQTSPMSVELLSLDRWRIESAFLRAMEMEPRLQPGYDPGWRHEASPGAPDYQAEFRLIIADLFAMMIPRLQLNDDPTGNDLLQRLEGMIRSEWMAEEEWVMALTDLEAIETTLSVMESELPNFIVPELVVGRIHSYGTFETIGDVTILDAEDTVDGISLISELEHVEETTVVPAKVGVSFGYEFELGGLIPGTAELLKMQAIHPPFHNVEGELQSVSIAPFQAGLWGTRYSDRITYAFNADYHLVPGRWTLQVLYGDQVVLSKDFRVVELND